MFLTSPPYFKFNPSQNPNQLSILQPHFKSSSSTILETSKTRRLPYSFNSLNPNLHSARPVVTRVSNSSEFDDVTSQKVSDFEASRSGDSYVGLFIRMLGLDNDPLDREQAVEALWKYSLGGKNCIDEIMKSRGSVILTVNLLKSDSNIACEAAAGLLRMVSSVNIYRDLVAESGAIEEITSLLTRSPLTSLTSENPVSHIPEAVYKTSVDWINNRSLEALGSFVLWSLDSILVDFASQQGTTKGSKKVAPKPSTKSQVGIFVALAMVLRRKPDALISAIPTIRDTSKYQGQDKLPIIVWMVAQASHGDLSVGLYSWSHLILPIVGGKSGSNPQTRDLILQSVERILSAPKARTILVNGAVRKGERLMPPSALDLLLRVTFPSSSARVKATERFEAVYPTLKDVALAGSHGSKAMKQVSQQILTVALKASGEGIAELSKEASGIFVWCLTENPDCYKQWEKVYVDNLEASVVILRRLTEQWKEVSVKQSSVDALGETIRRFKSMNEKALTDGKISVGEQSTYKEADKYCKVILGRLSHGWGCVKGLGLVLIAVGLGIAFVPPTALESLDLTKLAELVNFPQSV